MADGEAREPEESEAPDEEAERPEPARSRPPRPPRFRPASLTDLGPAGHVVVLFCFLINVWAGWQFYTPLHDNGWGDWDDHTWRRDTEHRNTFSTIFDPFLTTGAEAMDTSYVPVQSVIYHWSVNVTGQGPFPIRVLGIWLHILNALLIFVLTYRLSRSIPGAHLASLAFLLYPRNGYAIGWLCASLAHGLIWFFYLAAFLLLQSYLHNGKWWRLVLATLIFLTGMMTKEVIATLLVVIVLYDVLVVRGVRSLWPLKGKVLLGYVGRYGALAAIVVAALVIQKMKYDTGFVNTKFGGMEFGLRPPSRLVELMTLMVHWGPAWPRETVLTAMGGVMVALFTGVWLTRRKPVLLFLILWIPLVLTPFTISNFRDVHRLGRYVYEASGVLAVLIAVVGVRIVRWRPVLGWPVLCGAALLVLHFALKATEIIR